MLRFKPDEFLRNWERKLEPLNIIEVDKKRILDNYQKYQKLGKGEVWPVLKGNAYGVGIKVMTEALKQIKPRYVVVDSYMEALEVWQEKPDQTILSIGTNHINNLKLFDFKRVTLMVQNFEEIEELKRLDRKVKIHLKINTGMNRQGFEPDDLKKLGRILKNADNIEVEGVMSHLAMGGNHIETKKQETKFLKMADQLDLKPKYLHLGATEGMVTVKSKRINAYRVGIGLYGGAISWKSTIIKVRLVKKSEGVGYDFSQKMKEDGWVGVVAAGYYEGVDRRLSGKGWVRYEGKYFPIIGRISMNMTTVNFGKTRPKLFEKLEIVEFGEKVKCSIEGIAKSCETIDYDIMTSINSKLKRELI